MRHSASQQPRPGRGAASAVIAPAAVSWQLRQAAESFDLRLLKNLSLPPILSCHAVSSPLCRGRRKHFKPMKNEAGRLQTRTSCSVSQPRISASWRPQVFPFSPSQTYENLGKSRCSCSADGLILICKGLLFLLPFLFLCQG